MSTYNGGVWSSDMNSTVTFRAIDAAGNVGAWSSEYNLKIDKTAPVIDEIRATGYKVDGSTFNIKTNQGSYEKVMFERSYVVATEAMSGQDKVYISDSTDGPWTTELGFLTVTEACTKYFKMADKAGNLSTAAAFVVVLDSTPPTINFSKLSGGTVVMQARDPESGLSNSDYSCKYWKNVNSSSTSSGAFTGEGSNSYVSWVANGANSTISVRYSSPQHLHIKVVARFTNKVGLVTEKSEILHW